MGIIENAKECEALAKSVKDSAGVFLVPAFLGLGAPHWDSSARGTIFGLTRNANKAHIARAALEAVAHQVALDLLVQPNSKFDLSAFFNFLKLLDTHIENWVEPDLGLHMIGELT